jgi:hypothetical protein
MRIRVHSAVLMIFRYCFGVMSDAHDLDPDSTPRPTEDMVRERYLVPGAPAPTLTAVKDFIRFYIATSQPRIDVVPTVDSMNSIAEWLFAGFTRVTGTVTDAKERSEVYTVSLAVKASLVDQSGVPNFYSGYEER